MTYIRMFSFLSLLTGIVLLVVCRLLHRRADELRFLFRQSRAVPENEWMIDSCVLILEKAKALRCAAFIFFLVTIVLWLHVIYYDYFHF